MAISGAIEQAACSAGSEAVSTGENSSRPESLLRIDVNDTTYAALSRSADGIGKLLSVPTVQANADLAGSLDDFLGAVYALILAKQSGFTDRLSRPIEIAVVEKRARQIAAGKVRTDGKWMAGFHFNSALFRMAAVYHRLPKVVVGKVGHVHALRSDAQQLYYRWKQSSWTSDKLDMVHSQVNDLKHTPRGIHDQRTVTYQDAVAAVGELLDLVEAWVTASIPSVPTR
jgi:hypothetical protein